MFNYVGRVGVSLPLSSSKMVGATIVGATIVDEFKGRLTPTPPTLLNILGELLMNLKDEKIDVDDCNDVITSYELRYRLSGNSSCTSGHMIDDLVWQKIHSMVSPCVNDLGPECLLTLQP